MKEEVTKIVKTVAAGIVVTVAAANITTGNLADAQDQMDAANSILKSSEVVKVDNTPKSSNPK